MVEETRVLKKKDTWTLTDLPLYKEQLEQSGFTKSNSNRMELANVIRLILLRKVIPNRKAFIFTRPVLLLPNLSPFDVSGRPFHQLN